MDAEKLAEAFREVRDYISDWYAETQEKEEARLKALATLGRIVKAWPCHGDYCSAEGEHQGTCLEEHRAILAALEEEGK